ncbi:unnamed protein product [Vitrella brassicaformis CCMP3155]|uniref:GTP 3',8-cyclase n=1 Tax=Vitrella brassicaformis (strain CCMP3155) TaxID=1169540 RepID=A0A0G4GTG7_VITBC|nr:unnamed protein product [Vitrella brassicaformis CCMP3155]|mmetsp:Transcript_44044/g.109810  ORF Transcript_44044/g.109810 Transcript_44044/m.109810 type:complete len:407 (-) Transcript_44044:447-1667(-)|eukprot:CEM34067.1 unnamed protein product [Vitrella brassicaformis CCMP3155]
MIRFSRPLRNLPVAAPAAVDASAVPLFVAETRRAPQSMASDDVRPAKQRKVVRLNGLKSEHFARGELWADVREDWRECLVDRFGRSHTYLRISLTERCNLRCQYCMPADGIDLSPNDSILTAHETVRFASMFAQAGVDKIRLTGGEPTVRKDFGDLAMRLGEIPGLKTFAMTTNGVTLMRHIDTLKKARMNCINISLDTLVPAKFAFMARRNGFEKVWESINSALEGDFCQLKINCVVMKGFNDDELCDFVRLTEEWPVHIRFIEYMPFTKNGWSDKRMVTKESMIKKIRKEFPSLARADDPSPNETAQLYRVAGFRGYVGFISSMSDMFCGSCNRIRLTADGNLKNCLFGVEEFNIRNVLRSGNSDDEVMGVVKEAVQAKKKAHGGMHFLAEQANLNRPMIKIGG